MIKIKLFTTLLILLFCIKSKGQFISSFNEKLGKANEITEEGVTKSLITANDYLSDDAIKYLNSIKLPVNDVDAWLAIDYQKTCSINIAKINEKRKLLSEIYSINNSKNKVDQNKFLNDTNKNKYFLEDELQALFAMDNTELNIAGKTYASNIKMLKEGYEYYKMINSITENPKIKRRFFPLRSNAQAAFFYFSNDGERKINLVQDVLLQRNFDGSNSINSEILSGIIPIPSIPIKLSLGSTITQVDDKVDSTAKAANKLPYGGLFNATVTYPLFFSNSVVGNDKYMVFYIPLENKFNIDEVKDKQTISNTYYYNELSTAFLASIDLLQSSKTADNLTIFAAVKGSYISGGNKFYDKIGRKNLTLLQFNAGVKIAKKFTIAFNLPLRSSAKDVLDNQTASIALKFEPNSK